MKIAKRKFQRTRKAGLLVLAAAALIAVLATLAPQTVNAGRPHHHIDCPDGPVTEGDSFEVSVLNITPNYVHYDTLEPFEVYWSTTAITADERDYPAMRRVRQDGTDHETWQLRKMSKTFDTTEDSVSEGNETYKVSFDPVGNVLGSSSCTITIVDDDGPGAWRTWVDSTPGGNEEGSSDTEEASDHLYGLGDTISVKQLFTEKVTVSGDVNVGIQVGGTSTDARRSASYTSGSGTNTLTFEYTVTGADVDRNGIAIKDSDYGGSGSIVTKDDSKAVNSRYYGAEEDADQRVDGRAHVEDMTILSSPAADDIYRAGEAIEFELEFDRTVQVDGRVLINLRVGEGDDTWRGAWYDRGAGTDTLVFKYTVQPKDMDTDGIRAPDGTVGSDGTEYAFGGPGSLTDADGNDVSPYFTGLADQSDHQLDGRPYVTALAITSTPPNGTHYRIGDTIRFALTMDQEVTATSPLHIPVAVGSGLHTETWTASYSSSSEGNQLIFTQQD